MPHKYYHGKTGVVYCLLKRLCIFRHILYCSAVIISFAIFAVSVALSVSSCALACNVSKSVMGRFGKLSSCLDLCSLISVFTLVDVIVN